MFYQLNIKSDYLNLISDSLSDGSQDLLALIKNFHINLHVAQTIFKGWFLRLKHQRAMVKSIDEWNMKREENIENLKKVQLNLETLVNSGNNLLNQFRTYCNNTQSSIDELNIGNNTVNSTQPKFESESCISNSNSNENRPIFNHACIEQYSPQKRTITDISFDY